VTAEFLGVIPELLVLDAWGYRQFTLEDIAGHNLTFFRFSDSAK
jgi:hypothetical protein